MCYVMVATLHTYVPYRTSHSFQNTKISKEACALISKLVYLHRIDANQALILLDGLFAQGVSFEVEADNGKYENGPLIQNTYTSILTQIIVHL